MTENESFQNTDFSKNEQLLQTMLELKEKGERIILII